MSCEDRANTHGDRVARHICFAEEVAGGVAASQAVERDETCQRLRARARFVETDVPGATNAEDLNVDATSCDDRIFVSFAGFEDGFTVDQTIWHVGVFRLQVDMIKQLILHKFAVALWVIAIQAVVFI